jgi:hypothetical protein
LSLCYYHYKANIRLIIDFEKFKQKRQGGLDNGIIW